MKITKWIVYLLIFLLPVQLGKHFFLPFSYLSGVRIDYLSITIYLTDLLIMILLLMSLKRIKVKLSKKLLILFVIIGINFLFSLSPFISIYKVLKIILLYSLVYILKEKLNLKYVLIALVSSAFLQLSLVIYQLTQQQALQGIAYLLGERYFTISTPGIAKIAIQGVEVLRGYGTFSHPNSMGGFFLLLYTWIMFEKKTHNYPLLKYSFIIISSLLIFLSFSKIAIVGYLLINIYYVTRQISCRLCRVGRISGLLILSLLFITAQGDPFSLEKRIYLLQNAWHTILQYPLRGTGLGAYLVAQTQFPIPYSYMFFQPVHNIFLLLIAEIGIFQSGFIFYNLYMLVRKYLVSQIGLTLLFVICFTGFFDHYWLTLQQNIILIPVVFGLVAHQKWS